MDIKKLKAGDIECRVSKVTEKGIMLLLYKDARCDQRYLDETFGLFGWQRKHELIGGNLYCTVSVKDPDTGEWISKQDVGTESNTEKEKGQASDSFKRACFNWGIGRELYSAPTIWVNKGDYTPNDKGSTYDKFIVEDIGYDVNGNINKLCIVNANLKRRVYAYGDTVMREAKSRQQAKREAVEKMPINEKELERLKNQIAACGIDPTVVLEKVGVKELKDINKKQFAWICTNWSKEIANGVQSEN